MKAQAQLTPRGMGHKPSVTAAPLAGVGTALSQPENPNFHTLTKSIRVISARILTCN